MWINGCLCWGAEPPLRGGSGTLPSPRSWLPVHPEVVAPAHQDQPQSLHHPPQLPLSPAWHVLRSELVGLLVSLLGQSASVTPSLCVSPAVSGCPSPASVGIRLEVNLNLSWKLLRWYGVSRRNRGVSVVRLFYRTRLIRPPTAIAKKCHWTNCWFRRIVFIFFLLIFCLVYILQRICAIYTLRIWIIIIINVLYY